MKRKDVQQLITRGQQLQAEEGLGEALHQDLQSLDNTISKMEQNMDSQEQSLGVSVVSYQVMESLISITCVLILDMKCLVVFLP